MKKFLTGLLAITLILTLLMGCRGEDTLKNDKEPSNSETKEDISEPLEIETTGNYIGLIDSNSVEIEVDGKAMAFRLSEAIKNKISNGSLDKNTQVSIRYYNNDQNQSILTHITWQEDKVIGEYIGQIDSNSVETSVGGKIGAYRLSPSVKEYLENNPIEDGSKVEFTRNKNEYDQYVITGIKVVK